MSNARAIETAEKFNRFAESMGMPARCDASLGFNTPQLAEAVAIWREKAGESGLPPRTQFTARTLRAFLPHVSTVDLVETDSSRRFRFRLMGTAVSQLLGDHTGKFVDEAVVSPFRERWLAVMEAAIKAGAPLRIFGRLEYRQQDFIAMDMMIAPLGSVSGQAEGVLTFMYPSYSASHVFHPLVKNKLTAADALAS